MPAMRPWQISTRPEGVEPPTYGFEHAGPGIQPVLQIRPVLIEKAPSTIENFVALFEHAAADKITQGRRSDLGVVGIGPDFLKRFFGCENPAQAESRCAIRFRETVSHDRFWILAPE